MRSLLLPLLLLLPGPALAQDAPADDPLPPEWRLDGDGNGIPDFIEEELGYDPQAEDCPFESCGAIGDGASFARGAAVLVLDASGSMAGQVDGRAKMDIAKDAASRWLATASVGLDVGLVVYGHQGSNADADRAASCAGVELLAPPGPLPGSAVPGLLAGLEPTGWTPIAGALEAAGAALAGREGGENAVVLISDGIETCDGDPVAAASRLHASGLALTVDVVGFGVEDESEDAAQLRAIAEASGGRYLSAETAEALDGFLQAQFDSIDATEAVLQCQVRNVAVVMTCRGQVSNRAQEQMRALSVGMGPEQTMAVVAVQQAVSADWNAFMTDWQEQGRLMSEAGARLQALRAAVRQAYGAE